MLLKNPAQQRDTIFMYVRKESTYKIIRHLSILSIPVSAMKQGNPPNTSPCLRLSMFSIFKDAFVRYYDSEEDARRRNYDKESIAAAGESQNINDV
jgi:hypothetical protein